MRVLLTVGIFPPDIGGPATHIPKMANLFHKQGDFVTVVALKPVQQAENQYKFQLKLIPRKALVLRFFHTAAVIFKETLKADKVYSNGLFAESALSIRLLQKPAVAKIVGDPIWERERNRGRTKLSMIEFQSSKQTIKIRILRHAYRFVFNSYACITCPSQELVEVVKRWGIKSEVRFIPNGVEIPQQPEQKKEYDLIYVGRLVKWKNLDKVIYISSRLNLRTLFVGSGPEDQALKTMADSLNAPCFFVGEQSKQEVYEHLKSSKMFILVSEYEGQSFALLEAFASGLPAIVSNVSGNLATVTDAVDSLVLSTDELEASLSEIKNLMEDDERICALGLNAKAKVMKSFSEDIVLSEISDLVRISK